MESMEAEPGTRPSARSIASKAYALCLLVVGLPLCGGGAWLLFLGGSPYYVLAGLATLLSAIFTWKGDRRGAAIYAGLLVATIVWAIWEAGFDGWALVARLVAPFVLGLGFLVPAIARRLETGAPLPRRALRFSASVALAVLLGTALHAVGPADPPDPLYQTGGPVPAPAPLPGRQDGSKDAPAGEWRNYGNDPGGSRFSALDQINADNVKDLKVAWVIETGPRPARTVAWLQTTPLMVEDKLFFCTGANDVLAVDAETGRLRWRFRSGIDVTKHSSLVCRGVGYYAVPGATGPCAKRIYTNTVDARLIALDAGSGRPCEGFGRGGTVDLMTGMGATKPGYYAVTSAPTIVSGKIILGGRISDGQYWGEPSGVIRAYDAVTGKLSWAFDMGRPHDHAEPPAGQHYTLATPNSWAPMSADSALGLVYVPIGNATPDYYGAQRRAFDDRYSSSVVALDVASGEVRWSFQTVHHDLWDYDVPAQPTLVDIRSAHGVERALLQPTKRGEIFLLDRATGRPLAPVEERPVSQAGAAPGERLSKTQPFSVGMPAFGGGLWRERDMWGLTPLDQLWCRIRFRQVRYDGRLNPPGIVPTLTEPGFMGGIDWGGVSVDRDRDLMIVNSNRMGNISRLIPRKEADAAGLSKASPIGESAGAVPQQNTPFAAAAIPFLSPLGAPCNEPPFGSIAAVDLRSRKVVWTRPLGTARDSGPLDIPSMLPIPMGVPNVGGSIVTRGGLTFIAATQERAIRAIDVRDGTERWKARLPAGGQATPMTFWSPRSKRQFIVIAAGGHAYYGTKPGNYLVAFALPRERAADGAR
jgi:quinoprotein glucose dehydrogenase